MGDMTPLLVAVMAFGCVSIIIFVVGRYVSSQATMHRRLPVSVSTSQRSESVVPNFFLASLAGKFDEKKFGIEGPDSHETKTGLDQSWVFFRPGNTSIHISAAGSRAGLTPG